MAPQSQTSATPPPPSLHPDKISDSYITFISVACVMTSLSTGFVIARFVSRFQTIKLWWDDWTALAALVFAYGFLTTTILVATVGGAGYHITQYSLDQLEQYLKIALANNVIYNASITMSKVSVLLFYRRIFSIEQWLALSINMTGFLLFGYFFAAAGGLIFANSPIEGQWKLAIPSKTIRTRDFWLAMAIINISLDVIILALPQPRVWKLQLSKTRKVLVSLVFLLGGLVCVMSIARIASLLTINIADLTYTLTTPGIWTLVEMNTSIICACLPMIPSLFRSSKPGTTHGSRPTGYGTGLSNRKDRSNGYSELDKNGTIDVRTTVEVQHEQESDRIPLQPLQR